MKKTSKLLTVFLGFSLIGLVNCNNGIGKGQGYLSASVNFPQDKAFTVKVIPEETVKISVEVTGAGLDETISFELTKEEPRRLLSEVPTGAKTVNASAFDAEGQLLAQGTSTVTVIANEITQARVILTPEVTVTPTPTPTPSAEATPTPEPSALPTEVPLNPPETPPATPVNQPSSTSPEPDTGSGGNDDDDPVPTPTPTSSGASVNIGVTVGNGNPLTPGISVLPTPSSDGGNF